MAEKARDLVCGMEFDENTADGLLEYYGKIYYFCSQGCKEKFARDPDNYAAHVEREG